MESIIGNECYNANIQNYSSWGEWEGEGRRFRYPMTIKINGKTQKIKDIPNDVMVEELLTGEYRFGSNQVGIMRAIGKIVDMLRSDYDINLADHVDYKRKRKLTLPLKR